MQEVAALCVALFPMSPLLLLCEHEPVLAVPPVHRRASLLPPSCTWMPGWPFPSGLEPRTRPVDLGEVAVPRDPELRSVPIAVLPLRTRCVSCGFLRADVLSFLCAELFDVQGLRVKGFSAWPQLDTRSVNGFVPAGAGDTSFPWHGALALLPRVPSGT